MTDRKSINFSYGYKSSKSPCKGCGKRRLGCHDICADYIEYKKSAADMNDLVATKKSRESDCVKRAIGKKKVREI